VWDEVREELVADWGGRYSPVAQRAKRFYRVGIGCLTVDA